MSELSLRKPVGMVAGLACVAIALSAAAGVGAALIGDKPLWFMLGFEIVTLLAAVFGVLVAMGKFADGPGLALLCVMGAVAVGSVLGDLSTNLANPIGGRVLHVYGRNGMFEVPITTFMVGRLAAAGALGLCAAWVVLARRPKDSLRSLASGLACAGILLVVLVVVWKMRAHTAGLGALVRTLGAFGVGVVALGLLAAAVHYTVRAFEFGRLRDEGAPRAG